MKSKRVFFLKEVSIALLSAASITLLILELLTDPYPELVTVVDIADIIIALIILADLLIELAFAKSKKKYLRHNWYLFLSAIPITAYWAQVLRSLRFLRALRVLRAGQHLYYEKSRLS